MQVPELGPGVVFGIGATSYRPASCDIDGQINDGLIFATPDTAEEFFGQTGRRLLEAADNGASWAVMGIPGPVKTHIDAVEGRIAQNIRVTNNPALKAEAGVDPVAAMAQLDPAVGRLLEPGSDFVFLAVNDGDLAAQAAANLYATTTAKQYDVVADLIDGSGTGGALARRDNRFPGHNLFHPDPGLWEVGHLPLQISYPSRTYEETISGDALAEHAPEPLGELAVDDPLWDELANGLGSLALGFGINGGAELVVISGGTAVKAQHTYKDELARLLDRFSRSQNPMADKVPEIMYVPLAMVDTYELHGARGAMTSHLTRLAINRLVISS